VVEPEATPGELRRRNIAVGDVERISPPDSAGINVPGGNAPGEAAMEPTMPWTATVGVRDRTSRTDTPGEHCGVNGT